MQIKLMRYCSAVRQRIWHSVIEVELRLLELVYLAAQRDAGIAENIRVSRVHHARYRSADLELLICSNPIAIIGLGQLLNAHLSQRLGRCSYLGWLTRVT